MGHTAQLAPETVSNDLCWLLSRASHVLNTEMTAALESLGVSPRAHCVLSAALTGDHTQIELARKIGLDKTTMVVTLDELERHGLAERRPSATDRRARVIVVTEAGEELVRRGQEIAAKVREDVLSSLPEEDREAFVGSLMRLVGDRLSEPVACSHPVRRQT